MLTWNILPFVVVTFQLFFHKDNMCLFEHCNRMTLYSHTDCTFIIQEINAGLKCYRHYIRPIWTSQPVIFSVNTILGCVFILHLQIKPPLTYRHMVSCIYRHTIQLEIISLYICQTIVTFFQVNIKKENFGSRKSHGDANTTGCTGVHTLKFSLHISSRCRLTWFVIWIFITCTNR